jgi:three-Cys-motif partner protein
VTNNTTPDDREPLLLELPQPADEDSEPLVNPLHHPIWTANKARLIEEYLKLFVYVTHHGTYIDGFAGPQKAHMLDAWAAKRVLESQRRARRIRHFHLFELNPESYKRLEVLRDEQPDDEERTIELYEGDFNSRHKELLNSGTITRREATFCLLDQRTLECHWSTVKALAEYKTLLPAPIGDERPLWKIELFYFLAIKWLGRTLKATKNDQKLRDWWGRDDWSSLREMTSQECVDTMVKRFKEELGYLTVKAWPIFRTNRPGIVMYYMIHAADHEEAPRLMRRAYDKAVTAIRAEQLGFFNSLDDYVRTDLVTET